MKTKQAKAEHDKPDEETVIEPKTRARKKASDIIEEEKAKTSQDDSKTSKDTKKPVAKPRTLVKKRPLGIRKALRSKKAAIVKDKLKNVIKQTGTRSRKAVIKRETVNSQDRDTASLIPPSEIKKEPLDDTTPNSRSSSPKTAGRRQRLSSDMVMMKTMLGDTSGSLLLGPRTSPYSMRSERSNSPSVVEGKNLRSGKPRKVKNNLLNEVVMKEQKKRRRLLSDSKTPEITEGEVCKKLKRGRSCSRDGSEISKCSDNTESDLSLSEPLNDSDGKELKKLDKSKTDLDVDIENSVQLSPFEKVPSVSDKIAETKPDQSCVNDKKKKLNLKRSTSLDSDNNNSKRVDLDNFISTASINSKFVIKTENDTLLEDRCSILTSMSKKFNAKEITTNIRRARRGRKAAAAVKADLNKSCLTSTVQNNSTDDLTNTMATDNADDKHETLETLSKEIDDLINNLDENIDRDHLINTESSLDETPNQLDNNVDKVVSNSDVVENILPTPETPLKDRQVVTCLTNENTPSKLDDSDSIRLHYEEDSVEKKDGGNHEITYKCMPVASIDKLMDRLKEFEEFDKRRQRQESETKSIENKPVMVTSDVVLISKSRADIKLKDIQSARSPDRPIEKENVLSCFENNSAISIVKRDQVRKSLDVELPNSVTLYKRNSVSARKESTSSNHSRESDAISIFEKSLGKDVTLTELRKSVDKAAPTQVDLHQFATLQSNNSTPNIVGNLDSSQISITPRVSEPRLPSNAVLIIAKRKSRESISRKSSESNNEEEKITIIEKIKSPPQSISPSVSITPTTPVPVVTGAVATTPVVPALPTPVTATPSNVTIVPATTTITTTVPITPTAAVPTPIAPASTPVAVKSPESTPVETEALPPPIGTIKPQETSLTSEISKDDCTKIPKEDSSKVQQTEKVTVVEVPAISPSIITSPKEIPNSKEDEASKSEEKVEEKQESATEEAKIEIVNNEEKEKITEETKPNKITKPKSARNSIECQAGPSNMLNETPESKKRKEYVLRTLGLLTHKAAKEAKIEKLKERERIKNKAAKTGTGDYTGTLKTVIKLNRGAGEKKKHRSSLKMTFQKSKYRAGKPIQEVGDAAAEDESYYTIERREGAAGSTSDGGQRKSHYSNRLNNEIEAVPEPVEAKDTPNLVIPEKASSFSIHPGRLCMDQCFYCGGKFGLFDTPCHIAQIKSSERQKKVLDNEEKLTIDSCLCDACYRHVDRRANCPSYRKRPLGKQPDTPMLPSPPHIAGQSEKPASPPLEEESEEEASPGGSTAGVGVGVGLGVVGGTGGRAAPCHSEGCVSPADHSIRRKWLIKMRSSVNKLLKLKNDYPGLHTIPLCADHHRVLSPLMACVICRRRITKHHNVHFIQHGYLELNPLLSAEGVPVQFQERPVLCKACRDYCTLLQRPNTNDAFVRMHRRKILHIYNIEVPPESDQEMDDTVSQDDNNPNKKKKQRTKSKQRKSTEPEKDSESSERTSESTPEKEKMKEEDQNPLEEDIESLISSNKILVPTVKSNENLPSDCLETEMLCEIDSNFLHIDKQTELQYLLQKQNNPAQFLQKHNLTQKQRNILKLQTTSSIQKPGQQHRINDKNTKRLHKIGQSMVKEKLSEDMEVDDRSRDGIPILKNITLNEECTIESIPNRRPADINTLKNKWQMSESFTQVKRNLSELSKKLDKDPKKQVEAKYSNPVKRLETNPSISVRELFPGEEEMNLHCNIEFNNVKGVTPEGWEKCNAMIQYDVETKKLWTELQSPYGNQSSFLRHLILLEKYFRNGDLVLAHNATPHAANYSDSVQSRLRAFDNTVNDMPRRSEPVINLIEFRKKPSMNGKSLLKTNQAETEREGKKCMPPPPFSKPKAKEKAKHKPLPPELIAINTPNAQGRKAIQNVLHNIQQLVKGVSASDPTEVASSPLPPPKYEPPKEKKEPPKAVETPKKVKTTSKPWRPTLMPITPENLAKIAREPTQVAVDGRNLPSLVQVMSSGKRYHITLQDYNKMCIMRREKLQQLQDCEKKRPSTDETTLVTEIQPSTMLGNGGTLVQNIQPEEKQQEKRELPELSQIGANAATILKNVGLKNITIAPIPPKTATITSQTVTAPIVSSPSLLVATPIKIPQLGSSVSITNEPILSQGLPVLTSQMIMPKIPKSLTVIPQTVVANVPHNVMVATAAAPAQAQDSRP